MLLILPLIASANDQALITWIRVQPDHAFGSADLITSMEGCIVRAPEPKNENDNWAFYVLGHEVAHCFNGDYHKENIDWGYWDTPNKKRN